MTFARSKYIVEVEERSGGKGGIKRGMRDS